MGESRSNESGPPAAGRAWLTRRGFLTGVVGFGAVAGLARATEGPLWHQDAFAATAPSGPPTVTLPLPPEYNTMPPSRVAPLVLSIMRI